MCAMCQSMWCLVMRGYFILPLARACCSNQLVCRRCLSTAATMAAEAESDRKTPWVSTILYISFKEARARTLCSAASVPAWCRLQSSSTTGNNDLLSPAFADKQHQESCFL